MTENILLVDGISKSYAGVQALRHASFDLRRGEVHALVGENGAGKSTLIKIISGAVVPDQGQVVIDGSRVEAFSPRQARELGVVAIYQQPALFHQLTVAENIAIGSGDVRGWRRVDWRARRAKARELLGRVGARIDPDSDAGLLSMPQQQLVEIARALGADARVLILDEPTASLSEEDTINLFRVIRELRASGVALIYISHRLEELPKIADRVTVLRDGTTLGTYEMAAVTKSQLIQLMVGRELSSIYPKSLSNVGEVALQLRHLGCSANGVQDVSLSVHAGEIVGIAGLVGAGRTELAETIFGLTPADAGTLEVSNRATAITSPTVAIENGIAYLPEDRRQHGVVMDMDIASNISLASLAAISHSGMLDAAEERSVAVSYVDRLAVKTDSIFAPVSSLSGGNQQKVALARWLMTKPRVLILDEPTQGVDVGAKAEIHALISELAAEGVAIIMISSELPEILGMSDRIVVMRGGTLAGIVDTESATQEGVLLLALGDDHRMSA